VIRVRYQHAGQEVAQPPILHPLFASTWLFI
jgi:hypothetical protein